MTITQLSYFVTLARTLNFTRTAEYHYVSQTAVTQQIKLLEQDLGVELFRRNNRKVQITEAGRLYYAQAVKALEILDQAKLSVNNLGKPDKLSLKIGFMGTGSIRIKDGIRSFIESYPDIAVDFKFGGFEQILQHIIDRSIDVGILLEMFPYNDSSLEKKQISVLPQFVMTSKDNPLAQKASLSRKDLDGQNIFFEKSSKEIVNMIYSQYLEAGCRSIHISLENDMETILLKTACNMGIVVLSEYTAAAVHPNLDLVMIPLEGQTISLDAYWHKNNSNPALIAFLENM